MTIKNFFSFLVFLLFILMMVALYWHIENSPPSAPAAPIKLGLWYARDSGCDRIDVAFPQMHMGKKPHWSQIVVYDQNNNYFGPLSNYHQKQAGCYTYFGGNSLWPNSYYRFHGTKQEFRQRGLPRYIKILFLDSKNVPYSEMSPVLDLGVLPEIE